MTLHTCNQPSAPKLADPIPSALQPLREIEHAQSSIDDTVCILFRDLLDLDLVTQISLGEDRVMLRDIYERIAESIFSLGTPYLSADANAAISCTMSAYDVFANTPYRSLVTIPETSLQNKGDWVAAAYEASQREISDDDIVAMFDALEEAIYSDVAALDEKLSKIEPDLLAPEFAVGIPRALFPIRGQLLNWSDFVTKAKASISGRGGYDAEELFRGL